MKTEFRVRSATTFLVHFRWQDDFILFTFLLKMLSRVSLYSSLARFEPLNGSRPEFIEVNVSQNVTKAKVEGL